MSFGLGPLHIHRRKRATRKGLEPFPSPTGFKRYFDYCMYAVGFGTPLALVPQVYQIYTTHDVQGLALITWLLLLCTNTLWGTYGILHKETPLILNNIMLFSLNAAGVIGILLFR